MGDHYESFEVSDRDLESAFNPFSRRRISKNQQIYGIWADDDSDDEPTGRSKKDGAADFTKPVSFVGGNDSQEQDDQVEAPASRRTAVHIRKRETTKQRYFAGFHSTTTVTSRQDIGSWEKHTKGIGAKLLEKMGYRKGEGLGKSGQGMAKPLEPVVRPGRGAIGLYGPEQSTSAETVVESETVPAKKERKQQNSVPEWKRTKDEESRLVYRTWDQVVHDGGSLKRRWTGPTVTSKIIDMTSAEQRVYESYEDFADRGRFHGAGGERRHVDSDAFDVPELAHNILLILTMTEDAMISVDKQLKTIQDQNLSYRYEQSVLHDNIADEEKRANRLLALDYLLDSLAAESSIEEIVEMIRRLRDDFAEEYKLYGLQTVALFHVLPKLKAYFAHWDPLKDPHYGTDVMVEWRSMLEESSVWNGQTKIQDLDAYHQLVWITWMPAVRRAVQRWDVRRPDDMLNLLDQSKEVVPDWIMENLIDQFILPKVEKEVEHWDPLKDTQPLHCWLHPWLPVVGDRLQSIYPSIRHKLGRAMTLWNPSDRSAKWILMPWKDVFTAGSMSGFLSQHVLPKLENCIQLMVINPANQQLNLWHDVMDWLDLIHPSTMATLLVRHFFPKWHQALHMWLTCPQPNYSEISNWYSGWKSMFAEELVTYPSIRDQFTHALNMMQMALSGQLLPDTHVLPFV